MKLKELQPKEYYVIPLQERTLTEQYLECAACGNMWGSYRRELGFLYRTQHHGGWRYWPALKVMLCERCSRKSEDELRQMIEARRE